MAETLHAGQVRAIVVEMELGRAGIAQINGWLARGDGIAVYQNQAFDHSRFGERKLASYGSTEAMFETDEPPQRLPDIGNEINWAYQLVGIYRGELL